MAETGAQSSTAVKAFVHIRKLPFSRPSRSSVYLPLGHESLHILLRLRRPKATPREATSSFSFYLQGLDQRGHYDGFLLSANTKFVNPVFAPLEPATCDLMPTFISLIPFYILLNPVILSYSVPTTTGDSRPRRFAMIIIPSSLPNGLPRCALDQPVRT